MEEALDWVLRSSFIWDEWQADHEGYRVSEVRCWTKLTTKACDFSSMCTRDFSCAEVGASEELRVLEVAHFCRPLLLQILMPSNHHLSAFH